MQRLRNSILLLVVVIVLIMGVVGGYQAAKLFSLKSGTRTFLNTAALLRQIQTLSQLVTVKYVIEKVVVLEDVKWYGESRVLLLASGVVKSGVDLSLIKPEDIKITGASVALKLPPAAITDAYLDDNNTRIIERSTGILRTFDKDLEQTARAQAVDDLRRAARVHGINTEARDRAVLQLRGLLTSLGFTQIEIQ